MALTKEFIPSAECHAGLECVVQTSSSKEPPHDMRFSRYKKFSTDANVARLTMTSELQCVLPVQRLKQPLSRLFNADREANFHCRFSDLAYYYLNVMKAVCGESTFVRKDHGLPLVNVESRRV